MNHLLRLAHATFRIIKLSIIAFSIYSSAVLAAEAESEAGKAPSSERPNEGQAATDADKPGKTLKADKTVRRKKDDDVFNPSEEISEDYAVSFPVDI